MVPDERERFLEDGRAALEWVADYLDRVRELPVLAQVEPGDVRARLPAAPPEEAEPFSAVLRDLDDVLLPGITHWQHPRYFAYFAVTASPPGVLAELLAAALNPVAILWRTSPASTELEGLVCDWVAQLLGLPAGWHGHIEDSASTSPLAALIAARHPARRAPPPGATWGCAPSTPTPRARRARACSGCACARSRPTTSCGCASTGSTSPRPPSWCRRWAPPRPPRSTPWPRSRTCASARGRGCTSTLPTPARRWCAPSTGGRSRGSSARTRSWSTRTSGCSRRWTARCCGRAAPATSAPPSA